MNWQPLIEFVVSLAYGILSALVPIFNSEVYIVASQVGGFTSEVTTAVGCAVGQTIGKVGIVLALRRGGNSRLVRRLRERPRKPAGRFRTRLRAWSDRMLGLLGKRWWGVLIVFLSACVYIPPAVRGDPRRARDPDVGHLVWRCRPRRADAAVSGDSLRCLRVVQLSLLTHHGSIAGP